MEDTESYEPDNEEEAKDLIRRAVDAAAEISGVTIGGVAAFLMGGVVGADVGAAAGAFLSRQFRAIGFEVLRRQLSPREQRRVGAVLAMAAATTAKLLEDGRKVRDDGFFKSHPGVRSSADEIIDGVLISAQREHEERKLSFMANLLAQLAFDDTISRSKANTLVRLAGELSFSSLCIMHVVGSRRFSVSKISEMAASCVERNADYGGELITYIAEMSNMTAMGIMNADFLQMQGVVTWKRNKSRDTLVLHGIGQALYRLMGLAEMDLFTDDIRLIEDALAPAAQIVSNEDEQ